MKARRSFVSSLRCWHMLPTCSEGMHGVFTEAEYYQYYNSTCISLLVNICMFHTLCLYLSLCGCVLGHLTTDCVRVVAYSRAVSQNLLLDRVTLAATNHSD
jgi:hypothetical protein